MPQQRVTMRKIREILRLAWSCGQSRKAIALQCGVGKITETDTIARASAAGPGWPLPPTGRRRPGAAALSLRRYRASPECWLLSQLSMSSVIVAVSDGFCDRFRLGQDSKRSVIMPSAPTPGIPNNGFTALWLPWPRKQTSPSGMQ